MTSRRSSGGTISILTTNEYDAANHLTSICNQKISGASTNTNSRYQYGYDDAGNRTWVKRAHQSNLGDVYAYDAANQVTDVKYSATNPETTPTGWNNEVSYAFDEDGNRTSVVVAPTGASTNTIAYVANNLNEYQILYQVDGEIYPRYDTKGNLTSDGVVWTYSYDYENRLVSASNATTVVNYTYDAFGRLIKRQTSGASASTNVFCYAGWQLIAEYNGAGTLQTKYAYGAGIDEPVRMQRGAAKYYFEADGLGNVTELVSPFGSILERYTYDVYGAPSFWSNTWLPRSASLYANRLLFTGRDRDPDTGLYNFRHRYYSPSVGRFVQPDPAGLAGGDLNLYRYAGNCPTDWIDPYGLSMWTFLRDHFIAELSVDAGFWRIGVHGSIRISLEGISISGGYGAGLGLGFSGGFGLSETPFSRDDETTVVASMTGGVGPGFAVCHEASIDPLTRTAHDEGWSVIFGAGMDIGGSFTVDSTSSWDWDTLMSWFDSWFDPLTPDAGDELPF